MGLSPEQLAGLTPFQFELKCKGYKSLRIDDENRFRKLAYIIFCSNADPKEIKEKDITLDDVWPNVNSIKKAEARNQIAKTNLNAIMIEKFKKNRGLK